MSHLRTKAGRDVLALIVLFIVALSLAFKIGTQGLVHWIAVHNDGPVDELVIAVVVVAFGLAVFSFRRWRELALEMAERTRAEQALRVSEDRLQRVARATNDVIWDYDITTGKTLLSEAVQNVLGYSPEGLGDNPGWWKELIHPEDLARVQASMDSALAGSGETWTEEYRFRRKDGSYAYILDRAHILRNDHGRALRAVGAMLDITKLKEIEVELQRAKDAADAASAAKSEFLANMSHEIRTPLNGIIGMTELALDTELSAEQREYLTAVAQSGQGLLTVINDILDFSKIEARKLEFDLVDFDPRDCVEEALRTIALAAHLKGLELASDVERAVPQMLVGDPGRLRQVLVNLLGNAVKFTQAGEVVLSVKVKACSDANVDLHFRVRDTGIGVPANKIDSVFEAFTQADGSTTRRFGGTGLGLTISAALVRMMNGKIWLESELGRGSTVHFVVSLGIGKAKRADDVAVDLRGIRALVVDDNATNRRILSDILTGWQMDVAVAADGASALQVLTTAKDEDQSFDLVLTDTHMPEISGFELAAHMKDDPSLAKVSILMLTSDRQKGDIERCRKIGISTYLLKPIRRAELLSRIMAVVGSQRTEAKVAPVADVPVRSCSVLLAEDNPINQKLALRLLEKQGHAVTLAANGHEVLAAMEKQQFDVVLMDVQMPEMDGIETTRLIRDREGEKRHTPVIALTAHAMKGDRERCLGVGMDGYLSKPIRPRELMAALAEVVGRVEADLSDVLDLAALEERTLGDSNLVKELIDLHLEHEPKLLRELNTALTAHDGPSLEVVAHTLKGVAGNIGANQAYRCAQRVEGCARMRDWEQAETATRDLTTQMSRVRQALKRLSMEPPFATQHPHGGVARAGGM